MTALREHPRRPGRFVVELDGVALGAVSAEIVGRLRLRAGGAVDQEGVDALLAAMGELACYDKAVGALARRARSAAELRRWLSQRGFSAAEIQSSLARLEALSLLDDEAFARGFVHGRAVGRGFGVRRIVAELARRGVDSRIIDRVVAESAEQAEGAGGDERSRLEATARRRMRALTSLAPEVARRRLLGWLVRRGFGAGESRRVVDRLIPLG